MQCLLEVGEEGLGRHALILLFTTMHVIKEAIFNSNKATYFKNGVADHLEGIGSECCIVIFKILCFNHGTKQEHFVNGFGELSRGF